MRGNDTLIVREMTVGGGDIYRRIRSVSLLLTYSARPNPVGIHEIA